MILPRMTSRALGNGLTQTYEYYPWNQQGGRLKILAAGGLQNSTYVYDSVGNITSIADSVNSQTQSFGYDALDRLTSASANGNPGQGAYSETYQYDSATGNLHVKGSMTLDYLDSSHVHAVTNANSNTYSYDLNGNQITRHIASDTFNLIYDAENRLVEVKKNSVTIAQFTFDGDGARVKSVMDGETILFVGNYFEQKGSQATKYYFAGVARIAIRKYTIPQNMTVEYMMGDHLGSTSITTDTAGVKISELRYKPWGETRYSWTNAPATTPTYELVKYQYTGQYSYDAEFGLKFYGARFYDSAVGRFVSADTEIPSGGKSQEWDRYAYSFNDPIRYIDPSGHDPITDFLLGMVKGLGTSMLWWDKPYVDAAAIQGNESDAQLAGRVVGDVIAVAAGIAETVAGVGAAGGGVAACGTVVLCFVGGGEAVAAGAALAVLGATSVVAAGADLGSTIATISKRSGGGSGGNNSAQYRKLSDYEIKKLQEAGYDIHELKGGDGASKYNLYIDEDGNIYQKPYNGQGPGEPLDININDLPDDAD